MMKNQHQKLSQWLILPLCSSITQETRLDSTIIIQLVRKRVYILSFRQKSKLINWMSSDFFPGAIHVLRSILSFLLILFTGWAIYEIEDVIPEKVADAFSQVDRILSITILSLITAKNISEKIIKAMRSTSWEKCKTTLEVICDFFKISYIAITIAELAIQYQRSKSSQKLLALAIILGIYLLVSLIGKIHKCCTGDWGHKMTK